jgi:glutamyl-tRNA synthetase
VSVVQYRADGYLPQALRNWLVRIGWSHGDQEIFSADEICSLFDLHAVNRSSAQADRDKLDWLNQEYLRALPRDELVAALVPFLEDLVGHEVPATPEMGRLAELLRDRSRTLREMAEKARFLAAEEIPYEEKAAKKFLKEESLPLLQALHDRLSQLEEWSEGALEKVFEEVRAEHGDVGMGKLAQPVRVAVTGTSASPGIYETLEVLGQKRTVGRIAEAIHYIRHG